MMPIDIDGSVDDAHTILGVEKDYFTRDFKEYIQKERLNWSRLDDQERLDLSGRPTFGWVFWSQQDHQTQPDNFADLIRHALQKLIGLDLCLVQFWAPTKTSDGRTLLTTQFQPFALGKTFDMYWRNRLCEYRMGMCREYNNSFYADAECAQELLGLPGRVFLNQLPESTPDVKYYTLKEYPQHDLALRCVIGSSLALPVFDHSSHTCVGVLEIVSGCNKVDDWHDKSFFGQVYDSFQEFGLLCFDEHKHYEMQIGDENKACAFQELKTVLETVCKIHELPLAMTWVPCMACNYLLRGQLLSKGVEFCWHGNFFLASFVEVSKRSHLRKGGVAGMVLSSPNMLYYCSDITQLSLVEYPLVPYARLCNLRGWFTICLQSSFTANDIYVLEFFLPTSNRYRDNSRTSLSLILGTMEKNFQTFKLASGQELGDLLSVEVMDFQNGEIEGSVRGQLGSFICKEFKMMPIDGSVYDAHTILGVEEDYFSPDFKEYIQKERLNWWRLDGENFGHPLFGWVFWSQLDFKDAISLLCAYRMGMCREYNNSFYADAESGEDQLGLPGRVFLHQFPESTPDVKNYTLKEYPQRDLALRCKIGSSLALPVFEHSSHNCVGVLEIVSLCFSFSVWRDKSILAQMNDIFQEFGLLCFDGYKHYKIQIRDENKARTTAFQELKTGLETVCRIHKLPLAMTWVPCNACNYLLRGQLTSGVEVIKRRRDDQALLIEVSKCSHLRTGVVAGMVLSSSNLLYCSDITQLSLVEYPLVHYARHCKFRGWFTICLQSRDTANDIHVLEFFLPRSSNKSWTSLSLILVTMEKNFRTFKLASGQELGDLLSVEVMDFQKGRKLHSVQKIQAKGRGVRLQLCLLDASTGAIHSGTNDVSEDQNYILPSLEALQSGKFPTQLNSSNQLSIDQSRNAHNVVIVEQNILVVPTSKERKRKMQDRKHKKAGVKIGVSLEEILKCSNMKRKYAARELKVSISTFKRVCRGYHIHRWPPRNIENAIPFQPSPVENQRQIPQLNSDLPSNQALVGVSHIKPGFQDANMVTIRAKYENNNIKFRLPLSSTFVELREEVAKRLNIEAGTYYVKYKDEEDELILIACDEDLQDCMHTSRSLGKTSVVVLLELKQPITNLNPGLSVGQQTLFSPLRGQGLQSAEGELSNVPPVHNTGGVWLDAHFSYTPTIDEEETINKCMQDGSFWREFVDGCWISNTTVIDYSEMLGYYLSHCHFFCPNVIKNFKQSGRLLNKILPKTEKIFFPILIDRHWMLLVIDVKKKCFLWLDSMRCETGKKYSEDFANFLNRKFVFKRLREQNEWPIKYPEDTPIQENGNDCGVYMMAFMISLAVGDELPQLSQAQAQRMRRTICLELKKWDIIPQCPLVDYKFLCIQERKKNEALNEKLRKESTAALSDEVVIVSERRKRVKWADQVVERGKDN